MIGHDFERLNRDAQRPRLGVQQAFRVGGDDARQDGASKLRAPDQVVLGREHTT